jgi:regulator of RNase E activity RraA
MCGWAVTAQVETMTEANAHDPTGFQQLFHAVAKAPKPAVVVFQELGAHPEYAVHCGEIVATVLSRLGAAGMITDGVVRDLPEVRAVRFHCFARGAAASHARFRIARVGMPVQILGMTVHPGDLVHGDENGVLQIPAEHVEKLPAAVDAVRAFEQPLLEFVRGPKFGIDQLVARFLH